MMSIRKQKCKTVAAQLAKSAIQKFIEFPDSLDFLESEGLSQDEIDYIYSILAYMAGLTAQNDSEQEIR
jgi:hypothetical protein